ncbi:CHC2 zinc finger domain-containing protein, partial [Erwinia tasmaniensis]|uniref:CHC2 zinc finger domain-containing protein n=1 Tax=Erwinia tasmaniensis TaxID=338565 RepID=UPI003A4D479C
MPRIPQKELDELKRSISLAALAESQGHQLRKQGRDLVLLCPFHQEKTPSLVISPEKNLFHCFGCGAAGSVVDWMMQTEGFSLPKAVLRLRAFAGCASSSVAAVPVSSSSPPARQTLTDLDDDGQALLGQVVNWYHQNLLQSPDALAWLEKRGLNHP